MTILDPSGQSTASASVTCESPARFGFSVQKLGGALSAGLLVFGFRVQSLSGASGAGLLGFGFRISGQVVHRGWGWWLR